MSGTVRNQQTMGFVLRKLPPRNKLVDEIRVREMQDECRQAKRGIVESDR